ncbi:MAG: ATP-binding protein, partial [Gammaproteobacteria bacterium]|nr:ATP-binding protein [Gammaproteobacteria bacterium]
MENAIESAFSYPGVSRIVVFDDKLNIFSERKTNEYQQKYSLPFEGEEFPVISPLFSSYIVIFSPIYNTENVLEYSIGYCLIEFDKTLLVYSIARFVFIFALVIASVGILMWSFVLRYTRRFTSSLNSLSEHMAILSHYEPSSNATKEIADIEQTYLRMMKNIEERDLQIKSYIQELNDSNLNAKKQVIERTIELQKARDDAVSANMKKNEFLATISHEFRTPLQAIIGYTDLLEPATRNLSNLEDLSNIKTAAFDLMAMVNEILEFQRNEKGRFNLQPTTFSLERLRSEVVGILSPLSRINHNQLIVNIDGQTIEWHTDYFKLKQIITSLGSNACKFTNGGVIRISFNSAFTPSPILCIEITDTGIGISEDNLDAIFQPFKKIRTDNQLIEGTGLGLAVAKQFVEHLQGSILVESQINKGTQFLVEIPMFSDSEAIISKAKIRTPHSNKNELMNQSSRLLFLDDDPVILNILSRFVEGYGMTVDTANLL